jgi:hypothetical protein
MPQDGGQSRSKQFAAVRCLATPGRNGRVRIRGRPNENFTGMFAEPDCQIVCNEVVQEPSRIVSPGINGPATHRLKTFLPCFSLIGIDGFNGAIIFQSFAMRKWYQYWSLKACHTAISLFHDPFEPHAIE